MNRLQRFMMGRYGVDHLSRALLIISIILTLIFVRFNYRIIEILQTIILITIIYRTFSRNTYRRYEENLKFLKLWNPIQKKINLVIRRIKDSKEYRYFKCTNCKQTLRVPKGKGKISVTCPKCKIVMIKKS